jgi:zinc transporter 9
MGVLVGTSLIVIIPEGIETLYSANQVAHIHSRRGLQARNLGVQWGASLAQAPQLALEVKKRASDEIDAINALPGPVIPADFDITGDTSDEPPKTPTAPGEVHALEDMNPTIPQRPADQHEHHSDARIPDQGDEAKDEHSGTPHAWVGVSLISGFILMYLIDTLPSLKPPQAAQRQNIYSLSDLSASSSPVPNGGNSKSSFSTTLGLVIHSAADGIALGASSTQPSLSAIIFFAIFIHKAPAAFGLTSVLLKQGLSKRQARSHLIAFSLAAPIGAIFTFLVIHMLGGAGEAGGVHTKWWTGIVLLFSGGTFL